MYMYMDRIRVQTNPGYIMLDVDTPAMAVVLLAYNFENRHYHRGREPSRLVNYFLDQI